MTRLSLKLSENEQLLKVSTKVHLRRSKLEKLLARSDPYKFLIMIWAANSLLQQRKKQGLQYLVVPTEIVDKITRNEGPFFVWYLEALLNEMLIHSPMQGVRGRRQINCGNWHGFTTVYNALHQLSDAESVMDLGEGDITSAMPRMIWNQLQWGRGYPSVQYFYRYWYLYKSKKVDAAFRAKHSITLEKFCLIGFAIFFRPSTSLGSSPNIVRS